MGPTPGNSQTTQHRSIAAPVTLGGEGKLGAGVKHWFEAIDSGHSILIALILISILYNF
jgi:hypothetical protein